MKKLLSGILTFALIFTLGVSAYADSSVTLSDVLPGSWYYNEVSEMVAAGYIDGYEDGTFGPDRTVTVAEFVTMAARMTGSDTGSTQEHWAGIQMDNAYRAGWISETDVDRTAPDTAVSRELACKIIAAALGLGYPAGTVLPFADSDTVGDGYTASVLALYANGLLDGYEDNTLRPQTTLTRAQAATLLYRATHLGEEPDAGEDGGLITAAGYSADEIINYFCDVALGAEYGDAEEAVIRWEQPVSLYVDTNGATEADLELIDRLVSALNLIEGFPGITRVDSLMSANLRVSFVDSAGMINAVGNADDGIFNGYVTVSWTNYRIYTGDIYYRTELSQELRNAVIVEELCQSLGLLTDTYDHPDSIFYQYHTTTAWPTALDWAVIRLLYSDGIVPGMDESAVRTAAASLVG